MSTSLGTYTKWVERSEWDFSIEFQPYGVCEPCSTAVGGHWTTNGPGATNANSCVCEPGYSGPNCDVYGVCADMLPGGSLIGLLFNSDTKLVQYTQLSSFDDDNLFDIERYLRDFLYVLVDLDGDSFISVHNALDTLRYRSIFAAGMTALPLWCSKGSKGDCYEGSVAVSVVFRDAMINILDPKRTFDGSGSSILTQMIATYPKSNWDKQTCVNYDYSVARPDVHGLDISWTLTTGTAHLGLICGYINGINSALFTTGAIQDGSSRSVVDDDLPNDENLGKRVYCLSVVYCDLSSSYTSCLHMEAPRYQDFVCTVGLFYVR